MHGDLSNKGSDDEEKMSWKRRIYAAGHDLQGSQGSLSFYKVFLLLIAIHTSIFINPWDTTASLILLLGLVRGWLNGV